MNKTVLISKSISTSKVICLKIYFHLYVLSSYVNMFLSQDLYLTMRVTALV